MMPPIAMTSTFPPVVGDGCGTGVAVDKTDVAVDITVVAVEVGRVAVGVGAGCVAVAVWVWVGICIRVAVGRTSGVSVIVGGADVAGTTTGVLVGGTDVGVSVLTRVGTV